MLTKQDIDFLLLYRGLDEPAKGAFERAIFGIADPNCMDWRERIVAFAEVIGVPADKARELIAAKLEGHVVKEPAQ